MDTVNQIWEQVLEYIRPRLSQIAFDVYIKCMEPRNIEDGEMVVTVRTDFLKQNIIKLYSELLLEALNSLDEDSDRYCGENSIFHEFFI